MSAAAGFIRGSVVDPAKFWKELLANKSKTTISHSGSGPTEYMLEDRHPIKITTMRDIVDSIGDTIIRAGNETVVILEAVAERDIGDEKYLVVKINEVGDPTFVRLADISYVKPIDGKLGGGARRRRKTRRSRRHRRRQSRRHR